MSDLNKQRDKLEATFRGGWVSRARPMILPTKEQLSNVKRLLDHGGRGSGFEHEYATHIKSGAPWGSPLPARPASLAPFIRGMREDFVFIIDGIRDQARVAILFNHDSNPEVRFGYRFPAPGIMAKYADIFLMENIDSGKFRPQMVGECLPDADGIVWLEHVPTIDRSYLETSQQT